MRRLAWWLGGSLLVLTIGALIARATVDLWPLVLLAGLLGFVGWAVEDRHVQDRFPAIRTPEVRLHYLYEGMRAMRQTLRDDLRAQLPSPRPEWEPRVQASETEFWRYLSRYHPAEESAYRRRALNAGDLAKAPNDSTWRDWVMKVLDDRMDALDRIRGKG